MLDTEIARNVLDITAERQLHTDLVAAAGNGFEANTLVPGGAVKITADEVGVS
jgi:hypothetical protein